MTREQLKKMPAIDVLRLIVRNFDDTAESALRGRGYTVDQLLQLGNMQLLSDYDAYLDQWEPRQIQEALAGKPPRWDDHERPVYKTGDAP